MVTTSTALTLDTTDGILQFLANRDYVFRRGFYLEEVGLQLL